MLDFDTALSLLNKYGYTSIQVHPFIYQDGDTIGICYTYVDEEYGLLERIKIFNNAEEFEEFLEKFSWVQQNGKIHHVRMILDNYESINPKVMFLRNEKIMVEGEMSDIEAYDSREKMRNNMDPVSKVIYECGDLLLVYNEIKNRQLQYLKNIIKLKNSLRHKYFDLQKEVDKYNKIKVERNLTLLPEVTDSGINEMLEVSIKDRYNSYISQRPSYEEALDFMKEIWELCLGLELNGKYYEAQKEENDIRNEMKVVDQKLTLMRSLNEDLKPIFGIDLISRFRKINRVCKGESTTISNEFITQQLDAVHRKYSFFDKLDTLYTSDYLREAIQNTNYEDLAIKYAPGANFDLVSKYKTPLNEVAASLSIQYRDKLNANEQAIMVLYNNPKYRVLCDAILNTENFETLPIKSILKVVNRVKGFSKIKSECYEIVKKRIDSPVNKQIKASLFADFDFTSFETFIQSLVKSLSLLKVVNEKMVLNGDINMYVSVNKVEDIGKKKFVMTTNDLQSLIANVKDTKKLVGITLLKEGTPVLYSPYYFDVGDIYTKGASLEMYIKEMINFELLIDISDIVINIDPNKTIVAKYYSVPNIVENLSVVDDIKMSYKTMFCKYALTSKLSTVVTMNQAQAVASSVSPVVSSVFDAGDLASVSTEPVSVNTLPEEQPVTQEENKTEPVAVDNDSANKEEKVAEEKKEDNSTSVPSTEVVENKTEPVALENNSVNKEEKVIEEKEDNSTSVPSTEVVENKTEPVTVPPVEDKKDNETKESEVTVTPIVNEKNEDKKVINNSVDTKVDENKKVVSDNKIQTTNEATPVKSAVANTNDSNVSITEPEVKPVATQPVKTASPVEQKTQVANSSGEKGETKETTTPEANKPPVVTKPVTTENKSATTPVVNPGEKKVPESTNPTTNDKK